MKIARQSKYKVNGTPGSAENIEIMNKNLDANDVPVTEAANKLTAQETTELKNLVSSSRDPQVIASYLAAKSQQESLTEDNNEEDESLDYFYHASSDKLSYPIDFNKSKEIGLHIGTEEQALSFNRNYLYKLGIDKSIKCLDIKDSVNGYGDYDFSNTLVYYGVMTNEQASELPYYISRLNPRTWQEKWRACSKVYRDLLLNAGYSAIRYSNRVEGDGYSLCVFDNSVIKTFELYKEKQKTQLPNTTNDNLSEASYGGAYDIEADMYFTKDDLLDFTDELINSLQDKGIVVDLVDMYMTNGNRLVITVEDEDGNEINADEFIDMRKIRRPKDIYKYGDIFIKDILSQYNEFKSFNEDLDEIPIVDRLNFINKRRNLMPGIANINEFVDCLNATGKDKFMVKETKVGSNLSLADLKDEWMTLKKKGWKWYPKNIPGNFLTYYVFEKINKSENMNKDLVEDKNSPTLFDIDKLLCVTRAQYLGAEIPPAKRHCINEINIPHNMRFKNFKTIVKDYDNKIVLIWITQEPFNTADFEVFIKEVKSAFTEIIEDINYKKPFKVAVNVDCRDENCKKTELLTFNESNITEDIQTKYKFVYSALV